MFTRNLASACEFVTCMVNQAVSANTAVTTVAGHIVDMAGYQSITFVLASAAQIAANTPILSAGYSTSATNTTLTAFAATTSVAVGANTTVQVLELARPSKRFVAPIVTGGTGASNTNISVIAILTGREPQALGNGNPVDNMVAQDASFNTTTATFAGQMITKSAANTPTSKLIVANP